MRLAASLRYSLYCAMAALFASGVAWLIAHYFRASHSLPPGLATASMRIHGTAATIMLVLTGSAVALHTKSAWRERRNLPAGLLLSAVFVAIAGTGLCLYYAGDEDIRAVASLGHWLLGLALPLMFGWHAWLGRRSAGANPN